MRGAAVLADRGHRLVLVGVEALLDALGERGSGGGELGPGSHARSRCRARRARVHSRGRKRSTCGRDGSPARTDRRRAGVAGRAGRRGVAGAGGALLARSPGPAAGGGDGRVAGRAAAAAAARAGGVAAAHRGGVGVRGGVGRRATDRWRRSRARSPVPTGRRRARTTARSELAAPNGIHFHPPAGLLLPGARAASSDLTERMVTASPRPRARAARGGGDGGSRRRWSATCGPGSWPSGSRARRRARR